MQQRWTLLFLVIFQIILMTNAKGQYTIVAPGTLHTNSKYNVAVSLHRTTEPATLSISIVGPQYNDTKTIVVQPYEVKNVAFSVPVLRNGDYNITAEGLSGVIFKNSTKLNHNVFQTHVKIQTDKGKYKPGDVVNFRVLFMDENLRPSGPSSSSVIWFEDGKHNRVKEYKNFTVTKGVYTGKFQISEYPVLGRWRLALDNGGWRKTIVNFDVEKYVLPKYQVSVDATSKVSVKDGDMQVIVRANYTYGKPVNGRVTLILGLQSFYYFNKVKDKTTTRADQIIKATDMVNGKAKFDLSVQQYKDRFLNFRSAPLDITATVEENFTGVKINGTARATLHRDRYLIVCLMQTNCNWFTADKEMEMTFQILSFDGATLRDINSPVHLRFTEALAKNYYKDDNKTEPKIAQQVLEYGSVLDENSTATFKVKLPALEKYDDYTHFYKIQALYKDEVHDVLNTYQKPPPRTTDDVKTVVPEKPRAYFKSQVEYPKGRFTFNLDEKIILTINSSASLSYFDYNIVGRGNILVSERVFVPNQSKTYDLTFTPSFMWMPYARFYAYYIDELGDFQYTETSFQINTEMQNELEIIAPTEVKPGEEVALRIKTTPHSFVGLLAVDQSVLLMGRNNDISKNDFTWRLSSYTTYTPWQGGFSRYPGGRSGVVTLTNGNYFYNYTAPHTNSVDNRFEDLQALRVPEGSQLYAKPASAAAASGPPPQNQIAVRSDFAETWIFDDIVDTQTEVFNWTKKIPDTITSWVISGFALHAEKGLGVTTHTTHIVTFQPFFISVRLPYSVKRGEVINVPALVFNYLEKALDVEITLDNTDGEYEFTEVSNEVISNMKRIKILHVPAQSSASVAFMLRPKVIGNVMLKYTAISPLAGDTVHKMLTVVPEGVTEYANRAFFVNLRNTPEYQQSFDLVLPADVVPNSEHVEVSVIGNILGPLLNNLEHLLRMPTGCAEQTISTIMPNYFVLKYLKKINKLTPSLNSKILQNLDTGYQHMLGFRLNDGSFVTFHNKDQHENGSVWLTAYVARSLHKLQEFIKVDDAILEKSLQFLARHQAENGSFVDTNNALFGSARQQGVPLTAHVLLAFMENQQLNEKFQTNIENAINFILENNAKSDSVLAKALAAYTLQLSRHPSAAKLFEILKSAAKTSEDRMWWSTGAQHSGFWWRWIPNGDVEITSYALLTMLEDKLVGVDDLLPIVKWLVAQRNSYGGFISTQDTVLGLQALIEFAGKANYEPGIMDIDVLAKGGLARSETLKINEDNGLILQSVELPHKTLSVDFAARGKGAAIVQISYQYNILEEESQPSFAINTVIKKDTPILKIDMDVCVEYAGEGDASNMAILQITLPSGYVADVQTFKHIEAVPRVRQVESQKSDTLIVIYFESLPKQEIQCLPIEAFRQYAVAHQKPSSIILYDYYDALKRATVYYEVASKLCDICEDDEECKQACQ